MCHSRLYRTVFRMMLHTFAAHTQRNVHSDEDQQVQCWFPCCCYLAEAKWGFFLFKRSLLYWWSKPGSASCCSHVVVLCFSIISPCFSLSQCLCSLVPSLLWQGWNQSSRSQSSCTLERGRFFISCCKGSFRSYENLWALQWELAVGFGNMLLKTTKQKEAEGRWLTECTRDFLKTHLSSQDKQESAMPSLIPWKLTYVCDDVPRSLVSSTLCWRRFPWQPSKDTYVEALKIYNFGSGLWNIGLSKVVREKSGGGKLRQRMYQLGSVM